MVCHGVKINAIICISVMYERQRAMAFRAAHSTRSWHTLMAHILGENGLFAGLNQRTVTARALQQLEEAEYAGGEEYDVEHERIEHQVGPEGVLDQQRAHALEHVGRRQRPR